MIIAAYCLVWVSVALYTVSTLKAPSLGDFGLHLVLALFWPAWLIVWTMSVAQALAARLTR